MGGQWKNDSATHGLVGQGIDTLGILKLNYITYWIAIQYKDRESAVPAKELESFIKTLNELKLVKQSINPSDKFISILSLAKKASFNYDTFSKMLQKGVITIVESDGKEKAIGSETLSAIESMMYILL